MGRLVLRSSVSPAPSQPEFGDAGFNDATQTATASTIIFDLRQDWSTHNTLWLTSGGPFMQRAAAYTHLPTGGYWGSGCAHFVPGDFFGDEINNPRGENVCGLGQLHGFNEIVGGAGCRQLAVGQLFRFGSGWLEEMEGCKDLILQRTGDVGGGGRPMIVPKWYDPGDGSFNDIIFPACDDEICNCTLDPNDDAYGNPPSLIFNYQDYFDRWCWLVLAVDMDAGWLRTYISTDDGVHNGTLLAEQDFAESGTAGNIPGLDNFNYCNSVADPTPACYKQMTWVKWQLGSSVLIPRPLGFAGSSG